ncbi:MAG TPA: long-chain fatty acid--CoA ligase [Phaeodactylibacter sp.]|nr:long-chain fatty acid--CoA ligase [Phaeodactylibacter sp.]
MAVTKLFDFIYHQKENYPQKQAYAYKPKDKWIYFSTDEIIELANQASRGLIQLGVQPDDKVALLVYKNRPEWVIMDIAISQVGAINVPVYPTISPNDYEYIFNDAGVKFAFVGEGDLYQKVESKFHAIPTLTDIFTFDKTEGKKYWKDIFTDEGQEIVEDRKANVRPEELATLIYTSGTTGNPKGVMLSHKNIITNVKDVEEILPVGKGEIALSFLPVCHVFERSALYAYANSGVNVVFTGTNNLGGENGDLRAVKPHFFTTVPRLLEKVYEKIYNKGLGLTGVSKKLFFWALSMTDDFDFDKKTGLKNKIADKLIFSKWREALGGNIKGILTGAAACPVKMVKVFSAAGIPIREGYGLTETSPGLTINTYQPYGAMLGTVGPTLASVTLKIDDSDGNYREGEGEILARGNNIMMGYYNQPEKTAEVFKEIDGERWFCTGDIGKIITNSKGTSFLKITDRKKELLKTSGGKYVAPAPIENKFKEDFLIEHMMVVGEKQKFVSALIVPASEALKNWCKENGVECKTIGEAIKNPKVIERYQECVNAYNPEFSHIEQIKKFALLDANWEPVKEDGSKAELTPTLKLKRRVILEKYEGEIKRIYGG